MNIIPTIKPKLEVAIEQLNSLDIDRILRVKNLSIPKLKFRLNRGDRCYVAVLNKMVLSYHWVQLNGEHFIQQAGKKIKIKAGEAWIYHTRVADTYQGNRINGYVMSTILSDLKDKGIGKTWVYTNINNKANRKGLANLGFNISHKIYSIRLGNNFYSIFKSH